MKDYINKIYQAAKAIMDFGGMFEKVVNKKFSGEKFIKAMTRQKKQRPMPSSRCVF